MSNTTSQMVSDIVFEEQENQLKWFVSNLLPNSIEFTVLWKYPDEVTKSVADKDLV